MTFLDPNPTDLRKHARQIIDNGKNPRQAWSELKQWASAHGPIAMKSATIEFVSAYRGSSEAALIMPEVMRATPFLFSPEEKKQLISLATPRSGVFDIRSPVRVLAPGLTLPLNSERPALSNFFKPEQKDSPRLGQSPLTPMSAPFVPSLPPHIKQKLVQLALEKPTIPSVRMSETPKFDSTKSPNSFTANPTHGEHILQALTHNIKSHGFEIRHASPIQHPPMAVSKISKTRVRKALRRLKLRKTKSKSSKLKKIVKKTIKKKRGSKR